MLKIKTLSPVKFCSIKHLISLLVDKIYQINCARTLKIGLSFFLVFSIFFPTAVRADTQDIGKWETRYILASSEKLKYQDNLPYQVLIRHGAVVSKPKQPSNRYPITSEAKEVIDKAFSQFPYCHSSTIHFVRDTSSPHSPRFEQTAQAIKSGMKKECQGKFFRLSEDIHFVEPRKPKDYEIKDLKKRIIYSVSHQTSDVWVLSGQIISGLADELPIRDIDIRSQMKPEKKCLAYYHYWMTQSKEIPYKWVPENINYQPQPPKNCPKKL
ncbi:MAG: hypothetical protein AAGA80_13415 [Cyanobacteria bacterium P01_F01_bin.143]